MEASLAWSVSRPPAGGGGAVRQLAGSEKVDTKGFTYLPIYQLAPRVWVCRSRPGRCAGARSTLNPRVRARGCGGDSPVGGVPILAGGAGLGRLREAVASSPVDGWRTRGQIYICVWVGRGEEREREISGNRPRADRGTRQLPPPTRQLTAPNGGPKSPSPAHDEFCA
jgi:hypothetical protein